MGTTSNALEAGRRNNAVFHNPNRKWWWLAWLALLPIVILRACVLAESDTFWQIRAGLLTLENGTLPSTDPFSWTVPGRAWTHNSWGFNILLAVTYRIGGLPGVALACAALSAAAFGLAVVLARRLGASAAVTAGLLFLASPLMIGWLSARPQLVDYIAVLAFVLLLHRLVSGDPAKVILPGLGLLSILWVNMHAAVLLGIAISAVASVLAFVWKTTRPRIRSCFWALAIASGSALINPYGPDLVRQTLQVQSASVEVVSEWQSVDPADLAQMSMLMCGLIALVVAVRRRDAVFTAAIGVSALGSVAAIRVLPILLLLSLPVLAAFASHPTVKGYLHSRRILFIPASVAAVGAITVVAATNLENFGRPDPRRYSSEVAQAIPRNCKVFNNYEFGGFLILQRPDVQVSIDSRNDVYGPERVLAHQKVLDGVADPTPVLGGAGCVMVSPPSGLAQNLKGDQAWELRAADPTAQLFVRR